jgi:hypothetical protein
MGYMGQQIKAWSKCVGVETDLPSRCHQFLQQNRQKINV